MDTHCLEIDCGIDQFIECECRCNGCVLAMRDIEREFPEDESIDGEEEELKNNPVFNAYEKESEE